MNRKAFLDEMQARLEAISAKTNEEHTHVLYSTIGRALSAWSKMEGYIVVIVSCLLRTKTKKAGLVMYSIFNFSSWLSITTDLFAADDTFKHHQRKWNKLAERLREIKDKRDQLAHHSVDHKDGVERFPSLKAPRFDHRRKSLGLRPLTAEEISDFTDTVLDIADKLGDLADAMLAELDKQPPQSSEPTPGPPLPSGAQ